MREAGRRFDWDAARRRLDAWRSALAAGGRLPDADAERLLAERARDLARPLVAPPAGGATSEMLVFSLQPGRYAIPMPHAVEVFALPEFTTLPGAPPFLMGVVPHRGRIVSVVDLRPFFGLEPAATAGAVAILFSADGMEFAVAIDALEGIVELRPSSAAAPSPPAGARPWRFVLATAPPDVTILDLEALAGDPKFLIHDSSS
jgi:purine-binding chemotaxis protein CheW